MWPKYEVVTPQAVGSKTFTPPPLSGLTMPEVWDYNLEKNPNHANYVYVDPKTSAPVKLTWGETVPAAYRAGHIALRAPGVQGATSKPKFALVGVTDSITYATVAVGVIRAGFEAFLVSPRVSPAVLIHLLGKQGTTHVFVSGDAAMQQLITATQEALGNKLVVIPMPSFEQLYSKEPVQAPPLSQPSLDDTAVVLHSSGSTSLPKVVPYPHRAMILMGILPYHSLYDHCTTIAWHVPPMFHLLGVGQLAISTFAGSTISMYPPVSPPMVPTPDTALSHLVLTGCEFAIFPPILLHAFMMKPKETLPILAKLKVVAYGGGPLNRAVGDAMVAAGVKIGVVYGMTEVLAVCRFIPSPSPYDWEYVHCNKAARIHYRELGHGTYEPIIMESEWHRNNVNNIEIDGVKGYTTADVVMRHPTDPNAFRIIGRVDDQIVLSTGEKTNPVPLEGILMTDPRVGQVVSFGRGRPHGGVIIQPKPQFAFDPKDEEKLREFLDAIQPSIEKLNSYAPTHSRIMREMIIVASPDKPFVITQKGTPLRSDAYTKYEREINAAYEAFELSAESNFAAPAEWTSDATLELVRQVVKKVIPTVASDDDDLFGYGCDSLRAAWVRNTLAHTVGDKGKALKREVVYENPTIAKLATVTAAVALASEANGHANGSAAASKARELTSMIEKYTASFPQHVPSPSVAPPSGRVVLITGTTGGLGSNLLALLLQDAAVERVYAVNRASTKSQTLLERHAATFKDRGLDEGLLKSDKLVLVEAVTSRPNLGLPEEQYDEIRSSITHIIHNAWPVNFNYTIQTFEPAVQSVKELVDLALKSPLPSPPKFLFVSSVSVVRNATPGTPTPEDYVEDPAVVVGLGYGESKFVAESILKKAAEVTPLHTVSVRVGQLSGGGNGNWNASDWVPSIVRSAHGLQCLPDASGQSISWVRLDEAAAVLLEMTDSQAPVLHLVHPRPVRWTSLFTTFSQQTGVPLVPYPEWLARIEKEVTEHGAIDVAKARAIPVLRLLDFFRVIGGEAGAGIEGFTGFEYLATENAQRVSPTLREMQELQSADVEKWVTYWRRSGVVPQ
ncbi:acetyl-CoA synthetase-like protein [Auricularia subglabra TFB-10046 SS5]|nr:acetyl-CoA synthetase-like protein [Auricularia subglabra TFB-10046 SS5]